MLIGHTFLSSVLDLSWSDFERVAIQDSHPQALELIHFLQYLFHIVASLIVLWNALYWNQLNGNDLFSIDFLGFETRCP